MYSNISYDSNSCKVTLWTWDDNGHPMTKTFDYEPHLFVETTKNPDAMSIFNTQLKLKTFKNEYDKYKYTKESGIIRFFDNLPTVQQFLIDKFWRDNEKDDFLRFSLVTNFIDIEVYAPNEFPEPTLAKEVIDVVTIYNTGLKKFFTWGLKSITVDLGPDVVYTHCTSEESLLMKMIEFMENEYYDVLSGWNSGPFDIPYLVHRVKKLLGDGWANRLSPIGKIRSRVYKNRFFQDVEEWHFEGKTCADYLELYRKFTMVERQSWNLNSVAADELNDQKTPYTGSLTELSDNNWDTYVEYNIQDVRLLTQLDAKLQFINLLRTVAVVGLCPMEAAMGTLTVINGAAAIRAKYKNRKIPTFVRDGEETKKPGAYVREPQAGFQHNVMSFDANSLYPSIMISLNLSPETKVGKLLNYSQISTGVDMILQDVNGTKYNITQENLWKLIRKQKLALTKSGVLFSQANKGIVPEMLDHYYQKRVQIKKEMKVVLKKIVEAKKNNKSAEEIQKLQFVADRLHLTQLSAKLLLNSSYGYFGNAYSAMGDVDMSTSITLTGQEMIKRSADFAYNYIEYKKQKYIIKTKDNIEKVDNTRKIDIKRGDELMSIYPSDIISSDYILKHGQYIAIEDIVHTPVLSTQEQKDKAIIYGDTDSLAYDTLIDTSIGMIPIGRLHDMYSTQCPSITTHGHEITDISNCKISAKSFSLESGVYHGNIKNIIRHKVSKKKYKITVGGKSVIMTEDHGAMVYRDGVLLRVKPSEILKTDKMVVYGDT